MVKNYKQLEKMARKEGASSALDRIYELEKKESKWSSTLGSKEAIRKRLVEWYNEKGTKYDIRYQRPSFVLMQELKKIVKVV